jgi:hypothetical protein
MKKNIITDYTDDFIKGLVKYSGEHNAKDLLFEKTEALLSKSKHMKEIVHGELEVKYIAEIYNHVLSPLTETGETIPTRQKDIEKVETEHLATPENLALFENKIHRFLDENFIDQDLSSKVKNAVKSSVKRLKP